MARIAFDDTGKDYSTETQTADEVWQLVMHKVAEAIEQAGLPRLDGARWQDYGNGRIFTGTAAEVARVRDVLTELPVTVHDLTEP